MHKMTIPQDDTCLMVNTQELLNEQGNPGCEVEKSNQEMVLKGDAQSLQGIKDQLRKKLFECCREARQEGMGEDFEYHIRGLASLRQLDILPEQ